MDLLVCWNIENTDNDGDYSIKEYENPDDIKEKILRGNPFYIQQQPRV